MPTASYAPFLRFKQSGEFETAKRHVSWRVSLEFGVRGWRKSNVVGVGIGVEVFEIFEFNQIQLSQKGIIKKEFQNK